MVRRKCIFGAAVTRALLAVLLVTQAIVMADACAFAMPDCLQQCPSGPCNGLGPNICSATYARADQAAGSEEVAIPGFHATDVVGAWTEVALVDHLRTFARSQSPDAARPPIHILFGRMLN
jgi:hypothetical protein